MSTDVKMKGEVIEVLPNAQFRITLENGKTVRAYTSGKMRLNKIRVIIGDSVEVVVPPVGDICRLTFRF